MKKIYILFVALTIHTISFAQHQADNWYFGIYAGLNFSGGSPVALADGALQTTEGCATISDVQGNLLFYTNGVSVWNRNHQIMPFGDTLDGGISTTQSALIVPLPGSNDDLYYIFTLAETGGPKGFRYSIVDMTQDLGLGDVITKNVWIQDNVTEKIVAEKQSNGVDYWVVVHEWNSNAFYAYSLTAGGLQAPLISNTGIIHTNAQIQNTYGQMKLSTCGQRLAVAAGYLDTVQVFDIDPSTGIISNAITLPMAAHVYGVEFSPDGNLLYVTCYDYYGTLLQYDLSSGNEATINASKTILSLTGSLYALQLGPDEKIYVSPSFSSSLSVINSPNIPGTGCDFTENSLPLDPNYQGISAAIGLPEFVQNYFLTENSCTPTAITEVNTSEKNLLYPNPSANEFTLDLSNIHSPSIILVRNVEGKVVARFAGLREEKFSFGENLIPGIYTVSIINNSGVSSMMAVKEMVQ